MKQNVSSNPVDSNPSVPKIIDKNEKTGKVVDQSVLDEKLNEIAR